MIVDVLANDFDPDASDRLEIRSAEIIEGLGSVKISDNQLVYEPGDSYQQLTTGEQERVRIRYAICDSQGEVSYANLEIDVDGARDAMILEIPELHGFEDQPIAWPIKLTSIDMLGEQPTAIEISGLPVGAELTDGSGRSETITELHPSANVVGWDLESLSVTPPSNYSGTVELEVRLFTDHASDVDQIHSMSMTIEPVADKAILVVQSAAGQQDTAIPLSIRATLFDTDGSEQLQLEIASIPVGGTITDGVHVFQATSAETRVDISDWNLNSLRIVPASGSDADFALRVIATTTEIDGQHAVVESQLRVDVRQVVLVDAEINVERATSSPPDSNDEPQEPVAEIAAVVASKLAGDQELVMLERSAGNQPNQEQQFDDPGAEDEVDGAKSRSWRELLNDGGLEREFDFRPIDSPTSANQLSLWRTQPLTVLQEVDFVPVAANNSNEDPLFDTLQNSEEKVDLASRSEESRSDSGQIKQAFGVLWALVRSLSGSVDIQQTNEPVKLDQARGNRNDKNLES